MLIQAVDFVRSIAHIIDKQFSWEDVKQDKYREYYLGHSLMAPVGRWQKGMRIAVHISLLRSNGLGRQGFDLVCQRQK